MYSAVHKIHMQFILMNLTSSSTIIAVKSIVRTELMSITNAYGSASTGCNKRPLRRYLSNVRVTVVKITSLRRTVCCDTVVVSVVVFVGEAAALVVALLVGGVGMISIYVSCMRKSCMRPEFKKVKWVSWKVTLVILRLTLLFVLLLLVVLLVLL